ncbi:MAG: ribosomal-protein-alanine N-acetyltransferase [Gammaproteobacteria bacterium RBG_16_57_12]|nr:MAG: ribosomal-protein-alanine N-acetyltransferase [Gammaproteobacteria bacterium RBG_16_57_12]
MHHQLRGHDLNASIRPMSVLDVPKVCAIEQRVTPAPWSEQIFRDCIHVGYTCVVVEHAGDILGYGVLSSGAGEAHLLNLAIIPERQGAGLGKGLLQYLVDLARARGVETILLEVRVSNVIAQRLYHQAGFNEVGIRKDYYPAAHGREDAQIYAMTLTDRL